MKKLIIMLLMLPLCSSAQNFEGDYIKVNGNGGTPPYTYSINGGVYQVKDTFFNLVPGQYTINIKDSYDCIKTSVCTLYSPLTMKLLIWNGVMYVPAEQYISTPNLFLSIKLEASGGLPPYRFSRNSTTNYINKVFWNGLQRNTPYIFRVKDALGYIYSINITL
jgi:hypothetical protein